jgi:spermidine/putrescine-binding protein
LEPPQAANPPFDREETSMTTITHWLAGLGLAAIGLVAGAGLATPAAAQTAKPGPDLVVYTGTGIPTDFADALVKPFAAYMNEKYGVPVKVRTVPGAIPNTWAQLQTEWPNLSGDVYWLYNQQIRAGIEKGYWTPVKPSFTAEEWASFDQGALKTMNTAGYTTPMEVSAWVLVVQNSLPEGAVTTLADFSRKELAHRLTFDSALSVGSGYNAIAAAAAIQGMDWKTWFHDGKFDEKAALPAFQMVASWAKNALTLTTGSGSIRPLLRRREALVSAWWWHNAVEEVNAGTPVHIVEPKEGVVALVQSGPVISAKSKNPIAAMEWAHFVHSQAAVEAANKVGYINRLPRKGDAVSPQWAEFVKNTKFIWVDEFRDSLLDPAYNEKVLDLYSRVVIQGQ